MQRHDDDRLSEDFGRIRSETEESARVPDFRAMLEQAKVDAGAHPDLQVVQGGQFDTGARRRRVVQIGGWASAAVAASIAAVVLIGGPTDADREFERLVAAYSADASSGAWSPTSGLMDVTGMHLTRSMPSIGSALRGLPPEQPQDVPDTGARDL